MSPESEPAALSAAQRSAVAALLQVSPVVDTLATRLTAAGHQIALVGGSVRDALLGRLQQDLDFATDARPEQILAIVRPWANNVWETGIAYGTVGLRKGDYILEVTTYRSDAYDPASRKPAVTYGDTLEGDLARRDFTINAMALRLPSRQFVDPYGGLRDLVERKLRTPGAPEDSFGDDPLRMVRAARFAAQLGFDVAPEVVAAMRAMADRIDIVSAERVRDELVKLLMSPNPRRGLTLLVDTGLADHVLPELPRLRLEIDEHHRHKDVYEHTLTVLEQAMALETPGEADLTLRLAALMHDVGKPKTRSLQPGGGVSFHHHEVVGAHLTKSRLAALRFPRIVIDDVAKLVELHLRFHGYGRGEWTDSPVRRYVRDAGPLLPRLHALVRSDSTTRNRRKAQALSQAYDDLEARIERLRQQEEIDAIRPDLDGNQIMALLDLRPGPLVGRASRHMYDVRMERGPLPEEEATQELLRWWAEQPEASA